MLKVQEGVKEKPLKQKSKLAKYYDQNTKELPPLQTAEVVRVAPKSGDRERKSFKARVEDQVDIRSYEVRTEDGRHKFVGQPKETKSVTVSPSQEPSSDTSVVTSWGRVSRAPQYLQDFRTANEGLQKTTVCLACFIVIRPSLSQVNRHIQFSVVPH